MGEILDEKSPLSPLLSVRGQCRKTGLHSFTKGSETTAGVMRGLGGWDNRAKVGNL